jgi:uncharacterized membrane protein YfcA
MTESLKASSGIKGADRFGIWISTLCVIHCLATPLLISFSAVAAHLLPAEENTHRILATMVAAAGAIALVRGVRVHGHWRVLALMGAGLACIFCGAWFGDRLPSHACEVAVTMAGSALMITAHRLNHTFCRDCNKCTHTGHA